jgi:hypothetical protein
MTHAIAHAFAGVNRAKNQVDKLADRIGAEGVLIGDNNMTDLVHRLGTVLDIAVDYLEMIKEIVENAARSANSELRDQAFQFCELTYLDGVPELSAEDELKELLDALFGKVKPSDEPKQPPSFADGGFVSGALSVAGEKPSESVIDPARIKAGEAIAGTISVDIKGRDPNEVAKEVSEKLNEAFKSLIPEMLNKAQSERGKATMTSGAVEKAINELKEQVGVAPAPSSESTVTPEMPPEIAEIAEIVKRLEAEGNKVIVHRLR